MPKSGDRIRLRYDLIRIRPSRTNRLDLREQTGSDLREQTGSDLREQKSDPDRGGLNLDVDLTAEIKNRIRIQPSILTDSDRI